MASVQQVGTHQPFEEEHRDGEDEEPMKVVRVIGVGHGSDFCLFHAIHGLENGEILTKPPAA